MKMCSNAGVGRDMPRSDQIETLWSLGITELQNRRITEARILLNRWVERLRDSTNPANCQVK